MGHVFISYAREDRAKVSALASALEQHGLSVWMDERLVAGDHFDVAIEEALAAAEKVIVAWSPSSYASRWVRAEAGEGLERRILVPVLIEASPIPLEFRRVHAVDLTNWNGDSDSQRLESLLDALGVEKDRKGIAAPTALPTFNLSRQQPLSKNQPVSVDAIRATRYWGSNFRFRLRVDERNVAVQHVDFFIAHWLNVGGKRVSHRHWLLLPDYYEFFIETLAGKRRGELTILSDGLMFVNEISLVIDGDEVLRHRVPWRDGAISAAVVAITLIWLTTLILF